MTARPDISEGNKRIENIVRSKLRHPKTTGGGMIAPNISENTVQIATFSNGGPSRLLSLYNCTYYYNQNCTMFHSKAAEERLLLCRLERVIRRMWSKIGMIWGIRWRVDPMPPWTGPQSRVSQSSSSTEIPRKFPLQLRIQIRLVPIIDF